MTLVWGIWISRNEVLFNQVSFPSYLILDKCLSLYTDNITASTYLMDRNSISINRAATSNDFSTPCSNNMLICVDGACKDGNGSCGGYIQHNNRIVFS